MVDYWLDSSVFIEGMKGPYGFDLAPRFWTVLDARSDDGVIACPADVYRELQRVSDDLSEWAQKRKEMGMFKDPDAVIQEEYRRVCEYVMRQYTHNQYREWFLDGADPWLIAYAICKSGTVVTQEQKNPDTSKKVKIPNVCDHFKVRSITVYQMLRDLRVFWDCGSAAERFRTDPAIGGGSVRVAGRPGQIRIRTSRKRALCPMIRMMPRSAPSRTRREACPQLSRNRLPALGRSSA